MNTQAQIIEELESSIIEMIFYEINQNNLNSVKDIEDSLTDSIFEMIDSMQEVIYTYKAKEISKIIGLYDAFDTSDLTGERFDNWSQVAFENLYSFIYNEVDVFGLIERTLNNK